MASRRNKTGPRWTPTKPAPETSVALPPEAGEAAPGSHDSHEPPSPIVDDFIRHESAAEPSPVEAALVEAAPSPSEPSPSEPASPEPVTEPEPAAQAVEAAGPSASEAPAPDQTPAVVPTAALAEVAPAEVAPAEAAPVQSAPVQVGFPRRGETVRAAASTPLSEINATLVSFVRSEGQAALAHLDALSKATSPADALRLQFGEIQRAADASLTCFGALLRTANRFGFSPPRT